jgi:NAD(P)-dependent dehydrogenase (short-subunit alcohol dehydrogenase family)
VTDAAVDPLARFRLDGRVVLLTGASSGIGEHLAHVLHAAGSNLVLAARRADRLEALAAKLDGSVPVVCDVSRDQDLERLVGVALDRHGRVDVLVNNAGTADPVPAEDEPSEMFREVLAVNLTAVFVLTQLVGRHMLERGSGVVVNVASVLGLVASGQIPQAGYVASKGGLANLTRELAAQWARRGVRVNALAPAWFHTEMTDVMFADEGGRRWIRRNTPMGRPGELHELDGALLFLASDASTYVTGQVLAIDGGWTAV